MMEGCLFIFHLYAELMTDIQGGLFPVSLSVVLVLHNLLMPKIFADLNSILLFMRTYKYLWYSSVGIFRSM